MGSLESKLILMSRTIYPVIVLFIISILFSCAQPAPANQKFVGKWEVVSAILDNDEIDEAVKNSISKVFIGSKLIFEDSGNYAFEANSEQVPSSGGKWHYDEVTKELITDSAVPLMPDIKYSVQEVNAESIKMEFNQQGMGTTRIEMRKLRPQVPTVDKLPSIQGFVIVPIQQSILARYH